MGELTPEQIQELQDKAARADTLENQLKGMVPKEEVDKAVESAKKELEPQINPNWQKTRQIMNDLVKRAREKGVDVDDDGTVRGNPNNVNVDDLLRKAEETGRNAARSELLGSQIQSRLSGYDADSANLVKHFFDKLTAGETVTSDNIDKFMRQAHSAAEAETGTAIRSTTRAAQFSGGQGPRMGGNTNQVSDARAKELAGQFGLKIGGVEQK